MDRLHCRSGVHICIWQLWIQSKIKRTSKKTELNRQRVFQQYCLNNSLTTIFPSIYSALGIISDLEMVTNIWEEVCRSNTVTQSRTRYLSISGVWYPWGPLEQFPMCSRGWLCMACGTLWAHVNTLTMLERLTSAGWGCRQGRPVISPYQATYMVSHTISIIPSFYDLKA